MSTGTVSIKGYVTVWATLMLLLLATWGLSRLDLGAANTPLALLISGIKMLLVILIFMQVRFHGRSVWVFAAAGFFWFLIMVTLTFSDYSTRGKVRRPDPTISQEQTQTVMPHPR
jgi:cytochrome c oxidase subunit 4